MKRLLLILLCFLTLPHAAKKPSPHTKAIALLKEIKAKGAEEVLARTEGEIDQKLPQKNSEWQATEWAAILKGVESGDSLWIEVAKKLFVPAVGSPAADDLAASLAKALPVAPTHVLTLIKGLEIDIGRKAAKYFTSEICSPTCGKDEFVAMCHRDTTVFKALQKVRNRKLASEKKQCLDLIHAHLKFMTPS